jgi:prophage regulatory protein
MNTSRESLIIALLLPQETGSRPPPRSRHPGYVQGATKPPGPPPARIQSTPSARAHECAPRVSVVAFAVAVVLERDGHECAEGRRLVNAIQDPDGVPRRSSGQDASVTRRPLKLLRFPAVRERTGLSWSTIWRLERRGEFPKHHRIAPNVLAWTEEEVSCWIESRVGAVAI